MSVRTRFAPSPTGYLHIGGARTALFNYLYARHHGGTFVLRIEDTDRERSTPESIQAILDSLKWLDLDWDEGPFFQSERFGVHREHAERLLATGRAYRCHCTAAELEARRQAAQAAGQRAAYDRTCRDRNDAPAGVPFTVRFKAPLVGETVVKDLVRGAVTFQNAELDDIILLRSDGTPTYNFCVVVDDATMAISHIIRGEDHLTNTPKQIQIYQALGAPLPEFAHVPLIHGLDRARLSKRHGATSVMAYKDLGYLPEALNNYLVRLGWSHGDQEIFSRRELIELFDLDSVGKAAGIFNPEKLDWVNFQHLKQRKPAELAALVRPLIEARGWSAGDSGWLEKVVATLQERSHTLVELVDSAAFFFVERVAIDPEAAAKQLAKAAPEVFDELRAELAAVEPWTHDAIHAGFQAVMQKRSLGLGKLAQPVRVALTGGTVSPGIFEVAELLGKDKVLARLDAALPHVGRV